MQPLLDAETLEFIQADDVSIYVASADGRRHPHACRAFGCRPCPDGRTLLTWVDRLAAGKLLADIASNARFALSVTHPRTCRTVQLKSVDATIEPADRADYAVVAAKQEGFVRETTAMGYPADVMRAVVQARLHELVAIRFTPVAAFVQTPGPDAGAAFGFAHAND
ncbi:MAG: hypothetical protein KF911_09045 [Pseudomonadales bacterium]|nr:hypothetical protein [Pseudomonadales bacterium]